MNTKSTPSRKKTKKESRLKRWRNVINRCLWIGFILSTIIVVVFIVGSSYGWFGEMPDIEEIKNPESTSASLVYSADGETIGRYFYDNKVPAKFKELPKHLVDALVATEDERFYIHSGVDFQGVLTAVGNTLLGDTRGGSTVTQQLAKNLFHKREKSIFKRLGQKIKEWIIAVQLEKNFTKEEIIALYFDNVDYLYNSIGIKSAAKTYFSKKVDELTISEAATIVGMLKNPWRFNPNKFPERALERRNTVFDQMVRNEFLDASTAEQLKKEPIELTLNIGESFDNKAPYFVEEVRKEAKGILKNIDHPIYDRKYDIYKDGLKVYTTLDSRMQKYAEDAVFEHLKRYQRIYNSYKRYYAYWPFTSMPDEPAVGPKTVAKIYERAIKQTPRYRTMKGQGKSMEEIKKEFEKPRKMRIFTYWGDQDTLMTPMDSIKHYQGQIRAGFMAMEPGTGFVKAWVGGPSYRHFKYDMVNTGKRQVGSTFKPFVYATVVNQNRYSPCSPVDCGPYRLGSWKLRGEGGVMPMKKALALSKNPATARLMEEARRDNVEDLVRRMGITENIAKNNTIALGTTEIPIKQMIGAYGTFANQGIYVEPVTILRIEDKNGTVIYDANPKTTEVFSNEVAYIMLKMMMGVTEFGTSKSLRSGRYGFRNEIAGKTGTTNNNVDTWFIGIVPNLVAGGWSGFENNKARFRSTGVGQGATQALPMWGRFMKKVYADRKLNISHEDFVGPNDSLMTIETDCGKFSSINLDPNSQMFKEKTESEKEAVFIKGEEEEF